MKRVINGTSKEINGAAVEKVAEWDSKSVCEWAQHEKEDRKAQGPPWEPEVAEES